MKSTFEKLHFCVAGKNSIALFALDLIQEHFPDAKIEVLFNKNDDGVDRWQPSFRKYATLQNFQETSLERLYDFENLVFISLEFDMIVNTSKFKSSELFNIHFSALPSYKGMYTSAWPLLNAEKTSGVTLHKIDSGIDTGDIVDQEIFPIMPKWNSLDLYHHYLKTAETVLARNILNISSKNYSTTPQSQSESSYYSAKSIDYSNLTVNLNQTAFQIRNQIRAFTFRPFQIPKVHGVKVNWAEITGQKSISKPGAIVSANDEHLTISTIDYDLELVIDQYEQLWAWSAGVNDFLFDKYVDTLNLEFKNPNGWTALMISCFNGQRRQVEKLLSSGANVNAESYKGTSVLMYAFSNFEATKDPTICKLLIKHGADLEKKDNSGLRIEDYAKKRASMDLFQFLR